MRGTSGGASGARCSALWGKGSRGGGLATFALLVLGLAAPTALAAPGKPQKDTTPPAVSITGGPANLSTASGAVAFTFASSEAGTFQCSLDGSKPSACASPYTVAGPLLGRHTFSVRATDLAGNVSDAAATSWFSPYRSSSAYLPGSLLAKAQASPDALFDVIVQARKGGDVHAIARIAADQAAAGGVGKAKVHGAFRSIDGFPATLPGWVLVYLAERYPVLSITANAKLRADDFHPEQSWGDAVRADAYWSHDAQPCDVDPATGLQTDPACSPVDAYLAPEAPTIAVVDSGIDETQAGLGARVVGHVNVQTTSDQVEADDYGHGTFVASIAAGAEDAHPGAAPTAKLFDVRAIGKDGSALTSDVIAAADWILANKDAYGIEVANFSLHAGAPSSFKFDPLDRAVEALWFSGVTVVAASGNFGTSQTDPVNMYFAPGNDPFVITVGAADTHATADPADDDVAYWSAFGYTADGFAKPEVVAPGRYMVGAMPTGATIEQQRPDHVVGANLMQLSGTSFSAPVVAGAAATLLALHPDWTPDDVKGALMAGALPLSVAPNPLAFGLGEINLVRAAEMADPPNPNAGLNAFLVADATAAAGTVFDAQSWASAAAADQSWASQSWASQSWSDQSWASQSWASQSWASQSWSDQSWASQSWASQSWSDQSWSDQSWASQSWSDSSQADAALADLSWASGSAVD